MEAQLLVAAVHERSSSKRVRRAGAAQLFEAFWMTVYSTGVTTQIRAGNRCGGGGDIEREANDAERSCEPFRPHTSCCSSVSPRTTR